MQNILFTKRLSGILTNKLEGKIRRSKLDGETPGVLEDRTVGEFSPRCRRPHHRTVSPCGRRLRCQGGLIWAPCELTCLLWFSFGPKLLGSCVASFFGVDAVRSYRMQLGQLLSQGANMFWDVEANRQIYNQNVNITPKPQNELRMRFEGALFGR